MAELRPESYDIDQIKQEDIDKFLNTIISCLKSKDRDSKYQKNTEDKMAKMRSDIYIFRTKSESLAE